MPRKSRPRHVTHYFRDRLARTAMSTCAIERALVERILYLKRNRLVARAIEADLDEMDANDPTLVCTVLRRATDAADPTTYEPVCSITPVSGSLEYIRAQMQS